MQTVNLANNRIELIPTAWTDAWGSYDSDSGLLKLKEGSGTVITLSGNPILP